MIYTVHTLNSMMSGKIFCEQNSCLFIISCTILLLFHVLTVCTKSACVDH